ncbi:MAG: hypothetical protein ACPGU1_21600 [Myxococcota bacterium]
MAVLTMVGTVAAGEARAEIEFNWGGHIKSDLRFRIEEKRTGVWYDEYVLPVGVSRNENAAKLKMDVVSGGWAGVLDLDFVFVGISDDVNNLGNMSLRGDVDPYRIEAHALFIEALDLFEGFDMRIGYQKLLWGVGDQFNPTNNLNADDMEDELLFGDQQANAMIRLDWTPINEISMTAALVPAFRPSLLPPSGRLALAATDRLPMDDGPTRRRIAAEQNLTTTNGYPTVVQEIHVNTPELALDNMQAGFQFATILGEHDLAVNYFIGHHDVPVPVLNHTVQFENTIEGSAACPAWWRDVQDDPSLQQAIPAACKLRTETTVEFPRMQTIGLNMAGEIDLLGWISDAIHPIGYRLEVGVFFPEEKRLQMTQGELIVTLPSGIPLSLPAGEYDYAGTVLEEVVGATGAPMEAKPPIVLPDTPFAKWSLGIDYSFGAHVYLNMQWVHGLADEFGAGDWITEGYAVRASWIDAEENDAFQCGLPASVGGLGSGRTCATEMLRPRLGDYLVLGLDFKFLNDAALLRLFTMWDLTGLVQERWDEASQSRVRESFHPFTDEAFSAVIYPSFSYNFGFGLTLTAGALLKFGKSWTKFGDPAAGGSVVWSSAKFAF